MKIIIKYQAYKHHFCVFDSDQYQLQVLEAVYQIVGWLVYCK